MPRSLVGLLAAVGVALAAVAPFAHGSLVWVAVIAAGAVGALAAYVGVEQTSTQTEVKERQRLSSEVFGQPIAGVAKKKKKKKKKNQKKKNQDEVALRSGEQSSDIKRNSDLDERQTDQTTQHKQYVAPRDAVYDQLLINDYALGLTQARRAFNVSMVFSILGGVVLILGVALAIFRAETGGQVAGAAITSAVGALTSGLSQLFRGQSAKALKHLEAQAIELRKDVRAQTNIGTALRLLDEVTDIEMRNRLKTALVLQFTGATLSDFNKPSQLQADSPNGNDPSLFKATKKGTKPSHPSPLWVFGRYSLGLC